VLTKNSNSPLSIAVVNDHAEIAKLLIDKGANVNFAAYETSLLIYAAEKGKTEIARLLIENGANLNFANKNGDTPLTLAIWYENADIAKMLIEKGANVNMLTKNGSTALILAATKGNSGIIKLLLEKGADTSVRMSDGRTAQEIARQLNFIEAYNVFIAFNENVTRNRFDERSRPVLPMKVVKPIEVPTERLVLMPLRLDEDKNLQGAMETALVQGLQHNYIVFSGTEVTKKSNEIFLKESRSAKKECDETRCMQNIAMAFQSELIATANVTKQNGGYFLALSIQNVFDHKVVYSNSVACRNCDSFQVVDKLKELSVQ
jgi:ankyrin repeat protein